MEAIIAIAVMSIVVSGVISVFPFLLKSGLTTLDRIQATLLLEEGIESIKLMRDSSWHNNIEPLTAGYSYYFEFATSTWRATTTSIVVDDLFYRTFVLESVSRDSNEDIVSNGGTLDPDTKKVTVSISWTKQGITTTRSISSYVMNLHDN